MRVTSYASWTLWALYANLLVVQSETVLSDADLLSLMQQREVNVTYDSETRTSPDFSTRMPAADELQHMVVGLLILSMGLTHCACRPMMDEGWFWRLAMLTSTPVLA